MNSKISLIAIAIIGLMFVSIPADAALLSFHKSGDLVVFCGAGTKDTTFTETNNLLNGAAECAGIPGGGQWIMDSSYLGYPGNFFTGGQDSWIDLGAIYNISEVNFHFYGNAGNTPTRVYASNTTSTTGFSLIASFNSAVAAGWKNNTVQQTRYRYFRFEQDVDDNLQVIDEMVILGNPPPNITAWSNSYTNNASLNIAPPSTQNVIFSATAVDQPVQYYNWTYDGVDQANNYSSFAKTFTNIAHTVSVTVTNYNGTSSAVTWTINSVSAQPPAIPNGDQGAIAWDNTQYNVNDVGIVLTNVTYGLLDIDSYRIDIYSDKIPLFTQFSLDKSQTTESFYVQFPQEGIWTANLIRHSTLFGSDTILATDTAQVIRGQSYLFVPGVVSTGALNNVSWIVGYTPNHTSDTINIRVYDSNGALESIYGVSTPSTTANTRYYTDIRFNKEGQYTSQLTSSVFGVLDSKASQAFFTPANVTRNIPAPSFINVSSPFYAFSDTIEYGYQIDSANYTNYSTYISVYNWNQSVTTRVINTCGKQWNWLVHLPIVNGLVFNENCNTYDLQNDGFLSGLNKLSLRGQNATADIELAYVNFTIASTDVNGWGLSVDKNTACIGDTIRAKVIVPGTSAGLLKYGLSGSLVNYSVNSTVTIPVVSLKAGSFVFELYDNLGNLRMTQTVIINDCGAAATPTVKPGFLGQNGSWSPTQENVASTCSWWDGWVRVVFPTQGVNDISRFEFSLIIIGIVMVLGLLVSKGNFGVGIIVGFLPYAFFLFMTFTTPCGNYMPTWTGVLIALIIGIKMGWFR